MMDQDDVVTETLAGVLPRVWGSVQQVTRNEVTSVALLTVLAGRRLQPRVHRHRDELWLVLDGILEVRVDSWTRTARAGEVVWVPRRTVHQLGASRDRAVRLLHVSFGVVVDDDGLVIAGGADSPPG